MSWSRYRPELGDIAGIRVVARQLDERAQFWDQQIVTYSRVGAVSPSKGVFEGVFANAGGEGIAALIPGAKGFNQFNLRASNAHFTYASRLDPIVAEASRLRSITEYLDTSRTDAVKYRETNAGLLATGDPVTMKVLQGMEDYITTWAAQVEAGWDQLETDRRSADNAFNAAMVDARAYLPKGEGPILAGVGVFFKPLPDVNAADISSLTKAQLTAWLLISGNTDKLQSILNGMNNDPAKTADWWQSLGQTVHPDGSVTVGDKQLLVIAALPAVIGNLGGVTNTARDLANRRALIQARQTLMEEIKGLRNSPVQWLFPLAIQWKQDRLNAINGVFDVLYNSDGSPKRFSPVRQLISYDAEAPGAAISVGDLDAAKYTTYQVPGLNTTLAGSMNAITTVAEDQYYEQLDIARTRAEITDPSRIAVVAWLGKETPWMPGVYDGINADQGGQILSQDLAGLKAVQGSLGNEDALRNVTALSYGSVTLMEAAKDGLAANSVTMLGDIGAPPGVDSVQDFAIDGGVGAGVYRGSFSGDTVAPWGAFFRKPTSGPGFGAVTFGVDGTDGSYPTNMHGYQSQETDQGTYGYSDRLTQSSMNQARISLRLTDQLTY